MSANREWFHKNPTNRKRSIIRRLIPAVMACLLAVVTPVCGRAETSSIVVEDFRGKKLVFSKPVERVVCLLDSALTGLYMLNAEDRVVGVSLGAYTGSSARYYAAMDPRLRDKSLPVVSNSLAGSLERIIALEPDLVIVWTLSRETIDVLEERGIAVFGVFIDDLDDIYREVLALGRMTGTDDRAEHLVNYTKKQIAGVREKNGRCGRSLPAPGLFHVGQGGIGFRRQAQHCPGTPGYRRSGQYLRPHRPGACGDQSGKPVGRRSAGSDHVVQSPAGSG